VKLQRGIHAWIYPKRSLRNPLGRWPDPARTADELVSLGCVGTIPQAALHGARTWLKPAVTRAFTSRGLRVLVGLGLDSRLFHASHPQACADAIVAALDVPDTDGVMLNWEGAWNARRAEAARIVEDVIRRRPDAPTRCVDCPWWAPRYVITAEGRRQWTHPSAPSLEFGLLATGERFVQAYERKPDDNGDISRRQLAWSRHPSQYADIAKQGDVAAWTIRPSLQGYARSLQGQVELLLEEPTVCLWQWGEFDANTLRALRVVRALAQLGLTGPGAVREFQASVRLVVDGIVGPRTLRALGLKVLP
jgi:hypothetical protein